MAEETPRCGNCLWFERGSCREPRLQRVKYMPDVGGNSTAFMQPPMTEEHMLCDFHAGKVTDNHYREAV
jgi:hypothetical protein